jgi:hypothetical protein
MGSIQLLLAVHFTASYRCFLYHSTRTILTLKLITEFSDNADVNLQTLRDHILPLGFGSPRITMLVRFNTY